MIWLLHIPLQNSRPQPFTLLRESMKPVSQVMRHNFRVLPLAKINIDNAFLSSSMLSARLTWLDEITNHGSGDKNLAFCFFT